MTVSNRGFEAFLEARVIILLLVASAALLTLYVISFWSYLLFHSIIEISAASIAFAVFLIGWNSVKFSENRMYLFLGIVYLVVGCIDFLHTFVYPGMTVIAGSGTNRAAQLWIIARYTESIGLLAAPYFINRALPRGVTLLLCSFMAGVLVSLVFLGVFPTCFIDGVGLTPFKVVSEYVICGIVVVAIWNYRRQRWNFEPGLLRWLLISLMLVIAAEISFTTYTDPYGITNALGHFFKILSYFFIYRYLVEGTLERPYTALFRELERRRISLSHINEMLLLSSTILRHDLRNNLSVIKTSLYLHKETKKETLLDDVSTAVDQAADLIASVAEIEELARSGGPLSARSVRTDAEKAIIGCKVPCTIEGDCVAIADAGLTSVIRNVVRNAEVHSGTDRIHISISRSGHWCEVSVYDWGDGIPEQTKAHLFERGAKSEESKGLGLGLFIVRATVERYGGTVETVPNQPKGTVFVVRLRLA